MELSAGAKKVIGALEQAGFEAYAVGGCVRDSLLGKKPFDFDVATSAMPEEMMVIFRNEHVIETGIKHGTLTVLMDGEAVETTSFRIDGSYYDSRHPEKVEFTSSLPEDLSRRDFTINALAFNEKTGVIDLFGGISDLEHGIIRCVGEPDRRFGEDALRIMRALRFAAVLGFEIEGKTADSIRRNRGLLKNISAERIFSELSRLLCGKNAAKILLEHREVFAVLIPELEPLFGFQQRHFRHHLDAFGHTAAVLESIPPEPVLRFAALLHDIAKPRCFSIDENGTGHFYGHAQKGAEMAEKILSRLKSDNETKKSVCELIRRHQDKFDPEPKAVKRMLRKTGAEGFEHLLLLMEADEHGKRDEFRFPESGFEKFRKIAAEIIEKEECFSLRNLAIGGKELISAGIEPGPEMGKILEHLLEEVIEERIPNEEKALLAEAENFRQQQARI
ncbi:MAG: CCA tRNA nucleotidyltransferase [Oscillospiraceae bacterium]|nr:CCA tRNA nucleotidyltransferase [Oscillospiraceae bacterium]